MLNISNVAVVTTQDDSCDRTVEGRSMMVVAVAGRLAEDFVLSVSEQWRRYSEFNMRGICQHI